MVTALNLIGDSQLQNHWVRRLIAIILDWFIMIVVWFVIGVAIAIASIFLPGGLFLLPFYSGILWVIYSGFMEATGGATIGKRLVGLRVVAIDGQMDIAKAFIRNISKIYGLLLLIDWIVGFITDGDPRQRLFDRFANTTVIRTDVPEVIPGAYQPGGGVVPTPLAPQPPQPQYQAPQDQPSEPTYSSDIPPTTQETNEPVLPSEEIPEPAAEKAGGKIYTRSDLVSLRKDDLAKIARDKGMQTSGTKRDLIDRILGEGD